MNRKYRYGHRPVKRQRTIIGAALVVSLSVLAIGSIFIYRDLSKNTSGEVQGQTRLVPQVLGEAEEPKVVEEQLFSLELPGDWKETDRVTSERERSISWQATRKNADNRFLKLYIDQIPPNIGVNRMLPVQADGPGLSYGQISEDCADFTGPASTPQQGVGPTAAKWQSIDFICNVGSIVDNQIGTSSSEGVNTVSVTGIAGGKHRYFFLYTDHNIKPDYTILYEVINTFRAK